MKFNLEKFVEEKIAINCKTTKQATQLLNVLEKIDNSKSYLNTITDGLIYYSSDVCFRFISTKKDEQLITYSSIDWYIENGYKVVNFDDLVFEEADLSGLVVKYTNGWKGLIVTLGGKNYVLRGGDKFKPVIIELGDEQKLYRPKINTGLLEDILRDNNLELVWEKQEVDWSKIPIDTKVLCKDEDGWHRRYFAGVDDKGKPVVFYFGANSWTAGNNTTSSFPDIVLFEGNEHLIGGLDK